MFVYYVDRSYTTIISCKKVKSVKRWGNQVKQTNYITEWSMPNRIVVYYDDCGWDCIHEEPAIMCRRKFWLEEYDMERAKYIINDYLKNKRRTNNVNR